MMNIFGDLVSSFHSNSRVFLLTFARFYSFHSFIPHFCVCIAGWHFFGSHRRFIDLPVLDWPVGRRHRRHLSLLFSLPSIFPFSFPPILSPPSNGGTIHETETQTTTTAKYGVVEVEWMAYWIILNGRGKNGWNKKRWIRWNYKLHWN